MSLRSALSGIRRQALCSFHSRKVSWGDLGPVVSFSFDDFPRTAYTVGGAILKSVNATGTYYTAPGLMGTTNHLGDQFSPEDLKSLLRDGHELASHTFGHISARSVSSSAYCEDVDRGRKSIEEIAGVPDSGNFAYPYGDLTLGTKRILGPKVCSSRSIFPGLNGPDVDLNLLLANSLYGGDDQIEKARQLILENEKRKTWLIFYTHDVRSEPSRYGCTPALLEATASFARKRGSQILPVSTVLAEIGITCPVSVPVASS
jgi:peptidoglycan/xylan/chitin deacetylase (PgdA/CDA1 family)